MSELSESTRGEAAYRRLRAAIEDGVFKPGARMRETEVAAWLGVSRTPVREALQRLESRGLLSYAPHRGMVVAELDDQMVAELYALRETLEGTAAALAARHAAEPEIDELAGLLAGERVATDGDAAGRARRNRRFHAALYRAAHNRYVVAALEGLRESMALLGPTTLADPGRIGSAVAEHEQILEAVRRRDAAAAEAAARAHIRAAYRARLEQRAGG